MCAATMEVRMDALEGQLDALRLLLLSHLCAIDAEDPGALESTIEVAKSQSRAARHTGLDRLAHRLDILLQDAAKLSAKPN